MDAQVFVQTLNWIFPWRYFWMSLAFKSMDRLKLSGVSLIQSVENLHRTKSWTLNKREFLLPDYLSARICLFAFFLSLNLNWNSGSSWVLSLPAFSLDLNHQFSWVSILPSEILGHISLHNCMSQSLYSLLLSIYHLFICLSVYKRPSITRNSKSRFNQS